MQLFYQLKNEMDRLQKIKCGEYSKFTNEFEPLHTECSFVFYTKFKYKCKEICKYYKERIQPLEQEMSMISKAEKVLKDAAEKDFCMK